MTDEQKLAYGQRMRGLAVMFCGAADRYSATLPIDPDLDIDRVDPVALDMMVLDADPKLFTMKGDFLDASETLYDEFISDGGTPDEWNDLMAESGAMAMFGFGDGEDKPASHQPAVP